MDTMLKKSNNSCSLFWCRLVTHQLELKISCLLVPELEVQAEVRIGYYSYLEEVFNSENFLLSMASINWTYTFNKTIQFPSQIFSVVNSACRLEFPLSIYFDKYASYVFHLACLYQRLNGCFSCLFQLPRHSDMGRIDLSQSHKFYTNQESPHLFPPHLPPLHRLPSAWQVAELDPSHQESL